MKLTLIVDELVAALSPLRFGRPVTHVYNPLQYARAAHLQYVRRYVDTTGRVLLLGMNPGPWGMVQTGVPFGEIAIVRDWLGIDAAIGKPDREHPKRPVTGLACARSEVSGARLWGWAKENFVTPKRFFKRFVVLNYCPLAMFEESGRNRTPDRLPIAERTLLFEACDRALAKTVDALSPRYVIGIGAFAEARAREALASRPVQVGRILHPSPASPAANRGWAAQATRQLADLGISIAEGAS